MVSQHCSDVQGEPLPGSAKQEHTYLLLEHPGGWSHDILDGDTFPPSLTAQLKELTARGVGLQLIRHPGRAGRSMLKRNVFLVHAKEAIIEHTLVTEPSEVLDLDTSGPGRNPQMQRVDHPMLLVCTHGKRDVCCALKGRPLAKELEERFGKHLVWETSHTKGHRFAPSMLLMPWGYSFGRLNESAATSLLEHALHGRFFLPGNRGRGLYRPEAQVAELAVAEELARQGEDIVYSDLSVVDSVVHHKDGRQWTVATEQKEVEGVLGSCGDQPKTKHAVVATKVTSLNS